MGPETICYVTGYSLGGLGGRSVVVVRQADEILSVYEIFKLNNFNFKLRSGCLNGIMVLKACMYQ